MCIHLSCVLKSTEQLKKLDSIFSFYSNTWIDHRYHYFIPVLNRLKNLLYTMFFLKFTQLALFRIRITVFFTCWWKIKVFGNRFRFWLLYLWVISIFIIIASYKFTNNFYGSTFFSKFQSIWLEVYKDLFDSFFIRFNHMVLLWLRNVFTIIWILFDVVLLNFFLETNEFSRNFNAFWDSLILLNRNNLINCSFNVKFFDDFDKFTCL